MMELKQFRLTSGEEIVCEVVEWPDVESESADIVVRNVLKILGYNQPNGDKYYTFSPWMVFQDDSDAIQLLNNNHIMGEANPSEKLIEQYFIATKGDTTEESETLKADLQARLAEYLMKLRGVISGDDTDSDTGGNIVKFPGRVLH